MGVAAPPDANPGAVPVNQTCKTGPHCPRGLPETLPGTTRLWQAGILTGVTVSFFMAELYWRTDRRGSLLGKVSRGDLVAISQTPSYHSSGQSPAREHGLRCLLAREELWRGPR